MLRYLSIRNLAVIEAVEVEFEAGFNVLTGETGAGKSILVEAVGLLLGGRASQELVRTGADTATIEAQFDLDGRELIVRREVTAQGRSRAFIDGQLATAAALKDLAARLVELHGQHEHQALLDPLSHLPILDLYGSLSEAADAVALAFARVRRCRDDLERSRMDERERASRLDLIEFQLGEIRKAAPRGGEDQELSALKQVLASAERLQRLCSEAHGSLYDRDDAVLAGLAGVWKRVAELASIDPAFTPYLEQREGIKSQLEDLAFFLQRYADGIDASPARLQQVEDRLALLERLKRKHGPALDDVIARGAALEEEKTQLETMGERAGELAGQLADATRVFLDLAGSLSADRHAAARRFGGAVEALLGELGMARTRFEVRFNAEPLPESDWSERGTDAAEFFISPNPGEDLRPLARIVSGGELSRVMLALKTLVSADTPGKTLVFDEVDAGIGGRVADMVGRKLQALGRSFQVLCITHLPQIAACGATQFLIDKRTRAGRTVTSVEKLDAAGRVEEIARMVGGSTVTSGVRESAREMLAQRADGEAKGEHKTKGESERRKIPARKAPPAAT